MPFHNLTQDERSAIQTMRAQGYTQTAIAQELGRSCSTISRELRRNGNKKSGYCAQKADKKCKKRMKRCGRPRLSRYIKLVRYIFRKLALYWSPEQIAGRLPIDYPDDPQMRVSHETLYRWLYEDPKFRPFRKYLRRRHHKRRKHGGRNVRKVRIPNRVDIGQRPAVVEQQKRFGDWEADLVLGAHQKGVILTLVERKSMFFIAFALPSKHAAGVAQGTIESLLDMPQSWVRTITYDNGLEFAAHEKVAQTLDVETYFARPYASYERGKNENTNGLLRQYLPKKTSFKNLTQKQLESYVEEINDRPRKNLNYRTPREIFNQYKFAHKF